MPGRSLGSGSLRRGEALPRWLCDSASLSFSFMCQQQCSPCLASLSGQVSNHGMASARGNAKPTVKCFANCRGPRPSSYVRAAGFSVLPLAFGEQRQGIYHPGHASAGRWYLCSLLSSNEPRSLPQAGYTSMWLSLGLRRRLVKLSLSIMASSLNNNSIKSVFFY